MGEGMKGRWTRVRKADEEGEEKTRWTGLWEENNRSVGYPNLDVSMLIYRETKENGRTSYSVWIVYHLMS